MTKVGLFLCECGPNIAEAVDLDKVTEVIKGDKKVALIERHRLLCSEDGKKFLAESIKKNGFERIVIAACSPKQHENTFMEVMTRAGLNPYLFQMVNIREQCAWMTPDKELATQKAIRLIRAAINRINYHTPLKQKEIECSPDVLIIGAGITGIETALRTAQKNRNIYIVEKNELGGVLNRLQSLYPGMQSARELLQKKIKEIKSHPEIKVFQKSKIKEILGFFGNFIARIETEDKKEVKLNIGSIILTIGGETFVPAELPNFGYKKFENVFTADEFENSVINKENLPQTIAIVHCVGREKFGYCSKICCANSMKLARLIKEKSKNTKVFQFYKELCLPGKEYDQFYKETKEQGVEFIRYKNIEIGDHKIDYISEDEIKQSLSVDMIILSTGLVPGKDTQYFANLLNIPLDDYGFFKEEHIKLAPVSTITEGISIAGGCQGPQDLNDAVIQAGASAGRTLSSLIPGRRLQVEAKTCEIADSICVGCGVCVRVCTYGALTIDESKHISVVNEVLCRGCGNCAAACPSGAARHRHFTNQEIYQEERAMLK